MRPATLTAQEEGQMTDKGDKRATDKEMMSEIGVT